MKQSIIYVFDNFSNHNPMLLGKLYVVNNNGKETFGFEYDEKWLIDTNYSITIDPELETYKGIQYPSNDTFGFVLDNCPDRWGRLLIQRKENVLASIENRKSRTLNNSDFLLRLSDKLRSGGLRFKLDLNDDFVSNDNNDVPPFIFLRTLEEAVRKVEAKDEINNSYLDILLSPGSSLGGARPKANVVDTNGDLWIAKFPSKYDDVNVAAWEKVSYDLAKLVGLDIPETMLKNLSEYGSTILVKRFDRNKEKRIHFASCMTLLNKRDGDNDSSYLDILSFIKSNGSNSKKDSIELWKRIAFNMCINNTDDHLRNHAFILEKNGWLLSPLYDINPSLKTNGLALNIDEFSNQLSKNIILSIAPKFGIKEAEARKILDDIIDIINDNYRLLAKKYNISDKEIEYMSPAFNSFK